MESLSHALADYVERRRVLEHIGQKIAQRIGDEPQVVITSGSHYLVRRTPAPGPAELPIIVTPVSVIE